MLKPIIEEYLEGKNMFKKEKPVKPNEYLVVYQLT